MLTPEETGITERINELYRESLDWVGHAKTAANSAILKALECGHLLGERREAIGHGDWYGWLGSNCPNISPQVARRWIIIAKRYHGTVLPADATIRQLYQECGILPEPTPKDGEPQPEKTLFSPLRKTLDFYTPERLERLNEITGPGMIRLLDEGIAKLTKMKTALSEKFGAQKYG